MNRNLILALALLVLPSCGGNDDCQECTTATNCPHLTKQCSGFTATVQQCSGASGGQMCCVTDASEVSCSSLRESEGTYALEDGSVHFRHSAAGCGLQLWIDPVANGWIAEGARTPGAEAAVRARMREAMPNAAPR